MMYIYINIKKRNRRNVIKGKKILIIYKKQINFYIFKFPFKDLKKKIII